MGLSYSTDKIDETGKELLTYGTPDFPIAFFDDDLTKVKVPCYHLTTGDFIIVRLFMISYPYFSYKP